MKVDDNVVRTLAHVRNQVFVELSGDEPESADPFIRELPRRLSRYVEIGWVKVDDRGRYRLTQQGADILRAV